jgi:hypothetical protein
MLTVIASFLDAAASFRRFRELRTPYDEASSHWCGESGFRACYNACGVLYHCTRIDIGGLPYPPYDQNRKLREFVIPS